ncbi:hypothetical protein AB1Y20_004797 [Prymnesium parvum]|uniref:Carbohydrate kinase FGGY C-terminal domain-containing protein n=1 Tax=Prymnesium parvum TaxID=97485 RepID=A0AB34IXG6_PRYPA
MLFTHTALLSLARTPTPAPPRGVEPLPAGALALGFDFGTSAARCALVDAEGSLVCSPPPYPWGDRERQQTPAAWREALFALLESVPAAERRRISRIAVSGTSSSVVLYDAKSRRPSSRGCRMYDFNVNRQAAGTSGEEAMKLIHSVAPEGHTVRSPTSALAKVVAWHLEEPLSPEEQIAHQADFVAAQLCGAGPIVSDWHNALKLGYDVETLDYPSWMRSGALGEILESRLPRVVMPGGLAANICPELAARLGMPTDCQVVGGTTDSIAAFLAAGASTIGDAVTSLGSTLAIKLLSSNPVSDAARGVYSHRLGDLWLVGGASNAGCAVLREQGFTAEELARLSASIDPSAAPPHAHYYPLPSATVGERFPRADDSAVAVLQPVPEERALFLHSILYGLARIEADGYAALKELGASELRRVQTCGGGSDNPQWMALRERLLGVPTSRAARTDAALGAALLARGP